MTTETNTPRTRRRRQAVYLIDEGTADSRTAQVRGGKGAALAKLAALGMPVPAGFTVTTTVARALRQTGRLPRRLAFHVNRGLTALERSTGKGFGDADNPLLVSVRSGAAVSMPGMMDTVLNVGLNPATVQGLARHAGERFAFDTYRRFLALFGQVVLEVERERFEDILDHAKQEAGVAEDHELSAEALARICEEQRALIAEVAGRPVPDDPFEQLSLALVAVLRSWTSERAAAYRTAHNLPDWWGTAVTIQAMVFGNYGATSGTGVVFSRDVRTGKDGLYGEFLPNAQGEDVVAGTRTPRPVAAMAEWAPAAHRELERHVQMLAEEYGDVVDVEFTVEEGRLYLLQVRAAKRTPLAAATYAVHQVWAKRWSREEALERVSPEELAALSRPAFEAEALELAARERLLAKGLPASPGAAVGIVARTSARAQELAAAGEQVVLVRQDTSPDDLPGMLASVAIVTATGGATCHAAVVARGLDLPAVVGAEGTAPGSWWALLEGQTVSVDGATGTVVEGELPLVRPTLTKEANILLRWARQTHYEPRIGFEWVQRHASANGFLADVYLTDAMARASEGNVLAGSARQLRERIHNQVAECFAAYLVAAVAGELRHRCECGCCKKEVWALETRFNHGWYEDRSDTQEGTIRRLDGASREEQIEFFRLAAEVFDQGHWSSSFGGSAWARIARAPKEFLAGTLSPSVFVDHVFDLEHNGGRLFDKHPMLEQCTDEYLLKDQLDTKKQVSGVGALRSRLHRHLSSEVAELWQQGRGRGLW